KHGGKIREHSPRVLEPPANCVAVMPSRIVPYVSEHVGGNRRRLQDFCWGARQIPHHKNRGGFDKTQRFLPRRAAYRAEKSRHGHGHYQQSAWILRPAAEPGYGRG